MASTDLTRTVSSASNRKTWTWSAWVKRSKLGFGSGGNQVLFQGLDGSFPEKLQFTQDDLLEYDHDISGTDYTVNTVAKYRDQSAWYHIMWVKDTTQSTEADRIKLYVNGEQVSLSESQLGYPGQNSDGAINNNVAHYIGGNNGSEYFDGLMSHVHFVDGTACAPTVFGETDSTTGEWKIKTSPSFTPGTNGFTILKDGNTITDQSANSNNFTVNNGSIVATKDNPSNVFAVLDSNNITLQGTSTYAKGNLKFKNSSASWGSALSTLMPTSGKWYFESQVTDNDGQKFMMGICDMDKYPEWRWQSYPYFGYRGYSYYGDGKYLGTNSSGTANSDLDTSLTQTNNNDYIGMAVDLDNNKLYTHINGTYVTYGGGTQNPSTAAYPLNISYGRTTNGTVAFGISSRDNYNMYINFGNGIFDGTALTGTTYSDSNNKGIFKYQPPTNFLALCTSNLNQ